MLPIISAMVVSVRFAPYIWYLVLCGVFLLGSSLTMGLFGVNSSLSGYWLMERLCSGLFVYFLAFSFNCLFE